MEGTQQYLWVDELVPNTDRDNSISIISEGEHYLRILHHGLIHKSMIAHSLGYTLTGRGGPSIKVLQDQLSQCSAVLGLRQKALEEKRAVLNTLATNLSLYLTALQSIVPQRFLGAYRSPCWHSWLAIPRQQEKALDQLSQGEGVALNQTFRNRLYRKIFEPALHQNRTVLQCLPAFFLAGFPKSGTTTLHKALYRHRMIAKPPTKEPHWWTRMPLDNDQYYLRLAFTRYLQYYYNDANWLIKRNRKMLVYDGSQSTLWDSNFFVDNKDYCAMPVAVSHILPSAKFIVVMRNPVTRTFSHYIYSCTQSLVDREWLTHPKSRVSEIFHEQVVSEVSYFNDCLSNNRTVFECASHQKFSVDKKTPCGSLGYRLVVSIYYLHLLKWLQFFPRENFLFLRLEDMSKEPQTFMTKITRFLNISILPSSRVRWTFSHRENTRNVHIAMLPETRKLLSEFFRPFNYQLVRLTGDRRFLWENSTGPY